MLTEALGRFDGMSVTGHSENDLECDVETGSEDVLRRTCLRRA